jgi:prevent-host-death family protein
MQLTVSAARQRLGEVVTRVQDPNECIVMTRHGTPAAAGVPWRICSAFGRSRTRKIAA